MTSICVGTLVSRGTHCVNRRSTLAGSSQSCPLRRSWASIEAPVQPRYIFHNELVALADVRAAVVALETEYQFGPARAGWLRIWERLNSVRSSETKQYNSWDKTTKSMSLTDRATGEKLWFYSGTVEGYKLVNSSKGIDKLVWMPLTLSFDTSMVECSCLCLIEVHAEDEI